MKRALFLVDLQLDFMPGGNLPVPFGDKIVSIINSLIGKFDTVIASRDWHPIDHMSFTTNNPGTKILDKIKVDGEDMIIWPPHCIQNTEGASFHKDLKMDNIPIFTKGDYKKEHPFSGFYGICDDISVEKYLKSKKIEEVYVVGLAGDYCVKETALDCSVFFKTYFIIDAVKFIGDPNDTVNELVKNDIMIINSNDIDIFLNEKTCHENK